MITRLYRKGRAVNIANGLLGINRGIGRCGEFIRIGRCQFLMLVQKCGHIAGIALILFFRDSHDFVCSWNMIFSLLLLVRSEGRAFAGNGYVLRSRLNLLRLHILTFISQYSTQDFFRFFRIGFRIRTFGCLDACLE